MVTPVKPTRLWAVTAVAALICLLTACTTLKPVVADPTGAAIRSEIKPGDTVRVLTTDGVSHTLKVATVGESSLAGTEAAGSRLELPYASIRQLEVQRASGFKTTALVAAVVVAVVVAVASGGGSHTPGYTR